MIAWWSKTGEVLVAMSADEARRFENQAMTRQGKGLILDPVEIQMLTHLKLALREAPAGA
jgi:hypothetical protein